MSSKTLKARMLAALELMEPAIVDELRDQLFVLVFDSVTDGGEHSLALSITTPKRSRFVAISSFIDEESMTTDKHIRFLNLILDQYGLDVCNLVGIVCDNMKTNKAIARRIKAPMIGCATHRIHATSSKRLHADAELKTVKRIAVLRKNGFSLKSVPMHELRWSDIYRMLKRYKEPHLYLHFFERDTSADKDIQKDAPADDARLLPIVKFLPTAEEHSVLMDVLDSLMLLEDSDQRLQRKYSSLLTARDIFDEALIYFSELAGRLKADANIVESTNFEAAIVKIMNGLKKDLSSEEMEAAVQLLNEPKSPVQFAGPTRKRHPTMSNLKTRRAKTTANTIRTTIDHDSMQERRQEKSKYIDLSWIPATSVEVEKLFPSVKFILGYLRKSMNAETLEAILFLQMN
ncbi:hypothetical protein PHMEG_0009195 [Phytophthora megakarya]|uniref:HAT C-terminal dimerisation domain-containing protein n=1 Tax=Phytophthora megakarya TaxID=4795 RepID=A0A225WI72_9STRA|nr:hypothetical protein PHMEG_0009195 [Phytophthora megakarya]